MGFVMSGLNPDSYDRTYSDYALVARILRYFYPVRWSISIVAALVFVNALTNIALPVVLAQGINDFSHVVPRKTVFILAAVILLLGSLSWLLNYLQQVNMAQSVGAVVRDLRLDAFDAVLARDRSFYDEQPSGKIVSRVNSDTDAFSSVVTLALNLLSQLLLVLLLLGVLFWIDVWLAICTLAAAPLVVGISLSFRHTARRVVQSSMRAAAGVSSNIQEAISGITVAKSFHQEQRIFTEFNELNQQLYAVNLRTGLFFSALFPFLVTITNIVGAAVIYAGGMRVLHHHVTLGAWFLFAQAIGLYWVPLTSIASFWSQFQQGLAASERVFALIDAAPNVRQIDHQTITFLRGEVEFRNLSFGYASNQPVLQHFDLHIVPGETVALVGHTGAGKSTIGKLIARFYEYQHGTLLIDGRDIRTFDLTSYRRCVGIVPQTPWLFSGTIADNIRYGSFSASNNEVAEAATRIGREWLEALPQGLQTQVGESGRSLSMGQRQLVVLARIVLQNPAMLILDEATASMDPLTEAQIQDALDVLRHGRTAIIIAHRLSTIQNVNRIIVLRAGAIVEQGSHRSLLRLEGEYAYLFNTYWRHQSMSYTPGGGFVPTGKGADDLLLASTVYNDGHPYHDWPEPLRPDQEARELFREGGRLTAQKGDARGQDGSIVESSS